MCGINKKQNVFSSLGRQLSPGHYWKFFRIILIQGIFWNSKVDILVLKLKSQQNTTQLQGVEGGGMGGEPKTSQWPVIIVILAIVQKGQKCMESLPPGPVGTEVDTLSLILLSSSWEKSLRKGIKGRGNRVGCESLSYSLCTLNIKYKRVTTTPTHYRHYQQSPDTAPNPSAHSVYQSKVV